MGLTEEALAYIHAGFLLAFVLLLLWDCMQTYEIGRHPERWQETNPFLDKHPRLATIGRYFACFIVFAVSLDLALLNSPFGAKVGLVGCIIGTLIQLAVVIGNRDKGLP